MKEIAEAIMMMMPLIVDCVTCFSLILQQICNVVFASSERVAAGGCEAPLVC